MAGFVLLELIVAFAILAASSVVILEQTRALLGLRHRLNLQADISRDLANAAAYVAIVDRVRLPVVRSAEQLDLRLPEMAGARANVAVTNFAYGGHNVPLARGHSPFQIFAVVHPGGARVQLLLDALPPPRS